MSNIRFSIVIACYNQEAFIREAVESALAQKTADKEIIVVDDCSSDGTADILRTFGDAINLSVLPTNGGVYASRNHGASLANGEYLVFLDGDDVLMPWALDVYDRLITDRCPQIILGRAVRFHGQVPDAYPGELPTSIQFVEYARFLAKDRPAIYNTSALVVNRSHFWSGDGWTQGIFYQDIQDLLAKLGASGKTIFVVEPGSVWYRMHSTNTVNNVSSFVKGVRVLFANESAGKYPGNRQCRFERSAWFGGLVYYWAMEAIRTRCYGEGLGLMASGWWRVLLALLRRGTAILSGRKPIEQLQLQQD